MLSTGFKAAVCMPTENGGGDVTIASCKWDKVFGLFQRLCLMVFLFG